MKTKQLKVGVLILACGLFFALSSCNKEEIIDSELNAKVDLSKVDDLKTLKSTINSDETFDAYFENDRLLFEKRNTKKGQLKIAFEGDAPNIALQKVDDDDDRQVAIPDANFEQALIDLGVDDLLDGLVYKNNVKNITLLDVSSKGIADLTGIEHFKKLVDLNVEDNLLTSIDISKNGKLKVFKCFVNQLSSLDVSKNGSLTHLLCSINQLTSLDVSKNKDLEELWTSTNLLTSLDVTNNVKLKLLTCRVLSLTSLDVSKNTKLETLLTGPNNLLESLDVSNNPELVSLFSPANQLTSLNVKNGNNSNITTFVTIANPDLTCIDVDSAIYSQINWPSIDPWTSFSKDCSSPTDFCPSDLAGTHSFVSTNLQAETGSCPSGAVVGTVTWTYLGEGIYTTSDLSFGHYESTCWNDNPATGPDAKFGDDCGLIISGGIDQYGLSFTWTITGVSGSELYISWKSNLGDFSVSDDTGDVVITREGGIDWPALYTQ